LFIQVFFDLEKHSGIILFFSRLSIGKGEFEGKQFDFWFFDFSAIFIFFREPVRRTLGIDADFRTQIVL
jgi:hypothetical protein